MDLIPNMLPPGVVAYDRSPDFTSENLPAKLRTAHSTNEGTWGLIRVLSGKVRYAIEPPHDGAVVASAGGTVVISPRLLHHVEFVEPGKFFVEFYR